MLRHCNAFRASEPLVSTPFCLYPSLIWACAQALVGAVSLHLHHARTAARENEGINSFGGALVRTHVRVVLGFILESLRSELQADLALLEAVAPLGESFSHIRGAAGFRSFRHAPQLACLAACGGDDGRRLPL